MRYRPQRFCHCWKHAPNVRYLQPELDITQLHTEFCKENPDISCSHELFYKVVHELHISFACLGKEECTTCHLLSGAEKEEHLKEARRRKKSYEKDADRATRLVYTANLQKDSMLPCMEMFKEVAFCGRLVARNHSFVPADGSAPTKPVVANIWHKAKAGRTASEMATSMLAFLTNDPLPEADKITIWLDNCSYQKKNYCTTYFDSYFSPRAASSCH